MFTNKVLGQTNNINWNYSKWIWPSNGGVQWEFNVYGALACTTSFIRRRYKLLLDKELGKRKRDRGKERGERVQSSSTAVKLFTPLSQISESVKHKGKQIRQLNAIRMSKKIHFIFCFTRQSRRSNNSSSRQRSKCSYVYDYQAHLLFIRCRRKHANYTSHLSNFTHTQKYTHSWQ